MAKNQVWLENLGVWAAMPPSPSQGLETSRPGKLAQEEEEDYAARCPICLETLAPLLNRAVLTPCMHPFHHACISRWLEQKHSCPLCTRDVSSVLHNITREDSYDERCLPPPPNPPPSSTAPHFLSQEDIHRLDQILGVADLLRSSGRFQGRSQRHGSHPHQPQGTASTRNAADGNFRLHQPRLGAAAATALASGRTTIGGSGRGSVSLAAAGSEEARRVAAVEWRRQVYAEELWAVPLSSSATAAAAASHRRESAGGLPGVGRRQRRLSEWVDRELEALLDTDDTAIVRGFVLSLLTIHSASCPPPSATAAEGEREDEPVARLRPFLSDRARHFWHEVRCFASAPAYTIETYDRLARYGAGGRRAGGSSSGIEREVHGEPRGGGGDRRSSERRRKSSGSDEERRRERRKRRRQRADDVKEEGGGAEDSGGERERWRMWQWGDPLEE